MTSSAACAARPTGLLRASAGLVDALSGVVSLPVNGELLRFAGRYFYYRSDKARGDLGYSARHTAVEAVEEAYQFYRSMGII